jgi:hypothetical protein
MSAIGQTRSRVQPYDSPRMTYALLASLHVGDSIQLSSASGEVTELFSVIAIEHDVDEHGTPLPTLSRSRTIRVHARRENIRDRVVPTLFFATEGY